MPHVTYIYPSIGRSKNGKYIRSWQMQPLSIAALAALTPANWCRTFFDDRLEDVDLEVETDLVVISVETFSAKRGYQLADEYRKRGIPVVMGGYHAILCPDEVLEHADAICMGNAEPVWREILQDAENGTLKERYSKPMEGELRIQYDRTIFEGKNYFKLALVETGRGCTFRCSFCAITAANQGQYFARPVQDVVDEIARLKVKRVFFVDDNIATDIDRAKQLFTALKRLKIKWVSQASLNIAKSPELLDLMVESGCAGLLIGFESLSPERLAAMQKQSNRATDYSKALAELRKRGISVYGTFMAGFPGDSERMVQEHVDFAKKEKLFLAAFNHLIPFPGTPLYEQLKQRGELTDEKWWLSDSYRFGDTPVRLAGVMPETLSQWCQDARVRFYSFSSILKRAWDLKGNCRSFTKSLLFFGANLLVRRETIQRRGLRLGKTS